MKPFFHAKISAKRFGGKPQDYYEIHDWFDQCKAHIPDARHRMILHNAFGIYLCEQVFGMTIINSSGKEIVVRDIAEQHVTDDLHHIPTLADVFKDVAVPADVARYALRLVVSRKDLEIVD